MIILQQGQVSENIEPPVVSTKITKRAFIKRLTKAEYVKIDLASIGPTPQAAEIRRFIDMFKESPFFDLALQDNRADLQALEVVGLLDSVGRASVILDTPPKEDEIYR